MMGRASGSEMSGTNSAFEQAAAASKSPNISRHGMRWRAIMPSIDDTLDGRGVAVFRDVSLDLIADGHLVHFRVVVNSDTSRLSVVAPDRHILAADVVDPAFDRFLRHSLAHGWRRGSPLGRIFRASCCGQLQGHHRGQ